MRKTRFMTQNQLKNTDFKAILAEKTAIADAAIAEVLDRWADIHPALKEAVDYTLTAPGKRLRAAIVLWCCELIAGKVNSAAKTAAVAIEMVHTYSLVHDDLPAMDDDDLRRGKPSCHKAFDEATAILTGDALLTMAFELLSANIDNPVVAVSMIKLLSQAAGPAGMIAGQMADMEAEKTDSNLESAEYIHINKTAKMFTAATAMGAIAGGASQQQIDHLSEYGMKLGLCFQVADDILDVSSSSEQLGKTAGKDVEQGKVTYPSVVGMAEAKKTAERLARQAENQLDIFDERADTLRILAMELLKRTK